MHLESKELVGRSPGPGTIVWCRSCYTRAAGFEKLRCRDIQTISDFSDGEQYQFSDDNGRTWSAPTDRAVGVFAFADPASDLFLAIRSECVLPPDTPREDARDFQHKSYLWYRVCDDGGRTAIIDEQIIQRGPNYNAQHPCEGVHVGRNGMLACMGGEPMRTRAGQILIPIQIIPPLGPDGQPNNPTGGFTYGDGAVLIGTWTPDHRIEWDLSEMLVHDPNKSTRGTDEMTLAEMPDGRILAVIRGSNDVRPELPGYKWYTVSQDGGHSWAPMQPWTFTDGSPFFSPASCSKLLSHSNGHVYWIGNLCSENPRGNHPRHPLVIGLVDPESLLLIEDSLFTVAERQANDHPLIQFSNFFAYEDRETSAIHIDLTPIFPVGPNDTQWTGDAYVYRIAV
ncbi:MAG: exo-alpha-sialidase [Phycisphaerae bacterium]|nr:exo-alpha-sialidase [Phycisphaerae bacterium]